MQKPLNIPPTVLIIPVCVWVWLTCMLVSDRRFSALRKPQGISCRINFVLLNAQCTWKYNLCKGIDMLIHTRSSTTYEQIQLKHFIIATKKRSSLHCPQCPPSAECQSCLDVQIDCMSILSVILEGWMCVDLEVCLCISSATHLDQISTAQKEEMHTSSMLNGLSNG